MNAVNSPTLQQTPAQSSASLEAALSDLSRGAVAWRIWLMLGISDVMRRYKRSRLGQFWITGSVALLIGGLSVVYSGLLGTRLEQYLPYIALSYILWLSLASFVNEGCLAFLEAESYIKHSALPKPIYPMRVVVRAMFVLAHNAVIIPAVFLLYGIPVSWVSLLALLGLVALAANGLWIALSLAIVSARFRDLPQAAASLMQVAFFITPIMFTREQLPAELQWAVSWNPFASIIALIRDPLLGELPTRADVLYTCAMLVLGCLVSIRLYARFRDRIVYWL